MKYENLADAEKAFREYCDEKGVVEYVYKVITERGAREGKTPIRLDQCEEILHCPFADEISIEGGVLQGVEKDPLGKIVVSQAIPVI